MTDPVSMTVWLTFALVAITGVYAFLTFRILRANEALVAEMKNQRAAEARPYVTISLKDRSGTNLLYLTIKNTGRSTAEDLRLTLDRDFYQDGNKQEDRNMRSWAAFTDRIDGLPPNAELRFLLGTGPSLLADHTDPTVAPPRFVVSADYSFSGAAFVEQTKLDLRPFVMSAIPHDPVVEELERIRNVLEGTGRAIRGALEAIAKKQDSSG